MSEQSDPTQSSRFEEVLAEYLKRLDSGESVDRDGLLTEHPELASELESFFRNRDAIERLAAPLVQAPADTVILSGQPSANQEPAGRLGQVRYFGDYQLMEEIGRGAMGVVYRAEQCSLRRPVAVKMILRGTLATAEDVERFHREAEAAANLDHPQIVSVFEVGEHEGTHYFAMQWIEGSNLAVLLPELRNNVRRCVEILVIVSRAVHHAHQRGVLHRDVKPANILIDEQGSPYLTDFGLARRVDQNVSLTQTGAIVGTPAYMAPEQASAEKLLTTSVDVYSLGAILYETLAGHPPFRAETPMQTLLSLMTKEPSAPSSISRCDVDLETICLKCLQKDPSRRYDSAAALADDLERWLRGEAITARPVRNSERILKWARRNRVLAGLMAVSAILVAALLGLSCWSYLSIQSEAAQARLAEAATTEQLYKANILLAQSAMDRNLSGRARQVLEKTPAALRGWEYHYLSQALDGSQMTLPIQNSGEDLRFSPDGDQLFCAGSRECRWFSLKPGAGAAETLDASGEWARASGEAAPNITINYSGTMAAIDNEDGTFLWSRSGPPLKLTPSSIKKDSDSGEINAVMRALAFSPDGGKLYKAGENTFGCWDVAERQLLWTIEIPSLQCWGMAISPDENFAAMTLEDNSIRIVDLKARQLTSGSATLRNGRTRMQFTNDGRHLIAQCDFDVPRVFSVPILEQTAAPYIDGAGITVLSRDTEIAATGTQHGDVVLWDTSTGKVLATLREHSEWVHALAFSPDDRRLASGGRDRTVCLWRIEREGERVQGTLQQQLTGHQEEVLGLAFDDKGERLASGSVYPDGVRLWDLNRASNPFHVSVARGQVRNIEWFPDERRAAIGGYFRRGDHVEGRVEIWDFGCGRRMTTLGPQGSEIGAIAVSPDGHQVVCASDDGAVIVWDGQTGNPIRTIRAPREVKDEQSGRTWGTRTTAAAWSPDCTTLVVGDEEGGITAFDAVTGRELWHQERTSGTAFEPEEYRLSVNAVRYDATGRRLAVFSTIGASNAWVSLHRITDGTLVYESPTVEAECGWAFSSDRQRIAVVDGKELVEIHLEETPSTQIITDRCDRPGALAYSSDGQWLAVGNSDEEILLFQMQDGDNVPLEPQVLTGHRSIVNSLAFLKDNSRLVSGSWDNSVRIWALKDGTEILTLPVSRHSDGRVHHVFAVGDVILATNGYPVVGAGDFNVVVAWSGNGFRSAPLQEEVLNSK